MLTRVTRRVTRRSDLPLREHYSFYHSIHTYLQPIELLTLLLDRADVLIESTLLCKPLTGGPR